MPHKLFFSFTWKMLYLLAPDFICFFLNEISIAFINLYPPMTSIQRLENARDDRIPGSPVKINSSTVNHTS